MSLRQYALATLLAAGAAMAFAGPAVAAGHPAAPTTHHHIVKPTPAPPINAWHPGAKPRVTAKPTASAQVQPAASPTTVTLSTSANDIWPTQYATLTATADADVGPTPYWLSIYDATSNTYVASCGSGTTCSASVTDSVAEGRIFTAYLSSYPSAFPPPGEIANAALIEYWVSVAVNLTASTDTASVAHPVTLTATTDRDVGPSPFYIEIYDLTANSFLLDCATGTTCGVTLGEVTAKTDQFIAYVSDFSNGPPVPPGVQATSAPVWVTWSNSGFQLSLQTVGGEESNDEQVVATANQDVGPTPYYIELFTTDGRFVTDCGSGSTCTAIVPLFPAEHVVAFVSSVGTAFPPANIQASSNTVTVF